MDNSKGCKKFSRMGEKKLKLLGILCLKCREDKNSEEKGKRRTTLRFPPFPPMTKYGNFYERLVVCSGGS